MVDIRGRDITIGSFENKQPYIEMESGEDIEIFIDVEDEIKSNEKRLVTSELGIDRILRKGDMIYLGDGTIKASVLSLDGGITLVRTKNEGRIYEYSSIIVTDKHSNLSVIQEQDIIDLEYLNKKHRIDYISVPYASTEDDMKVVKRLISPFLSHAVVLAKVEDKNATILKEADGIIIQRRALGLSIVPEKLFALQNFLLEQ
jgi:pyruvate kinase